MNSRRNHSPINVTESGLALLCVLLIGCRLSDMTVFERIDSLPDRHQAKEITMGLTEVSENGTIYCSQVVLPKWKCCVVEHPSFEGFQYAAIYRNFDSSVRYYALSAYEGPVTTDILDSAQLYTTRVYLVARDTLIGSIDLGAYGPESRYNYYRRVSDSTYSAICHGVGRTPNISDVSRFVSSLDDFEQIRINELQRNPSCLISSVMDTRRIPNVIVRFRGF